MVMTMNAPEPQAPGAAQKFGPTLTIMRPMSKLLFHLIRPEAFVWRRRLSISAYRNRDSQVGIADSRLGKLLTYHEMVYRFKARWTARTISVLPGTKHFSSAGLAGTGANGAATRAIGLSR